MAMRACVADTGRASGLGVPAEAIELEDTYEQMLCQEIVPQALTVTKKPILAHSP